MDIMNPEDQRTSCPGFLDEYGIWNNGFECPSLSNRIRVCCGSDSGRYCCTLEDFHTSSLNPHEKSFLSTNETTLSLIKKINLTFLTLPFKFTFILIIILLLLVILMILFICYRFYQRKNNSLEEKHLSTKQTLLIDHFPFSPPHHQLFFNDNNNQQIKDTLTTSTSSLSARLPSDIYFNDWKEFSHTTEQFMNIYPTVLSHNNERHNYLFHGKYQQDDIIV